MAMVEEKRLDMLFYELASEDRLAILRGALQVQVKNAGHSAKTGLDGD